jgi:hypothetical protein
MNKEASWIAVMLAVLLVLMALLSPPGAREDLPLLETLDRPAARACRAPLMGALLGQMQRWVMVLTWQLESFPAE